jgi:serine/threonine protein kinase
MSRHHAGNIDATDLYEGDEHTDPRLLEVSREYLSELESGSAPDRNRYLLKYPELKEEIEECLDGVDLAFTLQKSSKPAAPFAIGTDAQPLGDFRIVKEIGRGGMGIVYEATQLSLGRHVALKVLPFAASLDERHLQRFRLEAQAAAQLHHNNIVPVYAVGCDRGTHYYAMQLINGQPISPELFDSVVPKKTDVPHNSTLVDVHTKANERMTTIHSLQKYRDRYRTIAALVAQVADALEYAHSCGVVHRDVKPGNLLLDAYGKVWITDFGLAHVAANNHVTQTGDLVGTLRYMSPEQASGQRGVVDHRSDIYSLGATLYELLTRKPIYDGQDRQTLLHQILNEDCKPPRQSDPAIPIELETIVLKATQHAPADRYTSAEALAADLRRYLDEIPILAKRPTMIDKVRKWMRRHPSAVASIFFTLAICVIALGVTAAAIAHQKSLVDQSFKNERERAVQAERRLELAQRAAGEMITLAADQSLDNFFEEWLRQRLLMTAMNYYQTFIAERTGNQAAQSELQATLDQIRRSLSDLDLVQTDRVTPLLAESAIQKDLNLSKQQVAQLDKFFIDYPDEVGPRHDGSPPDRGGKPQHIPFEKAIEKARIRQEALRGILTANQQRRLGQITLQLMGPFVITRDIRIIDGLGLTNAQRRELHAIGEEFKFKDGPHDKGPVSDEPNGEVREGGHHRGGPAGRGKKGPGGPWPSAREVLEQYLSGEGTRPAMAAMLEALTPEQRQKWSEFTGPPLAE